MGLWILIVLNIITKVYGYSNGIFPNVCESMLPEHTTLEGTVIPAQTTPDPPFDVLPEPGNIGDHITVSLKSRSNTGFIGFMLEARERINGTVGNRTVGQFILLDTQHRLLSCNNSAGAAVSQRNNQKKTLIRVNWTAPAQYVDITFRATFLETHDTFWKDVDTNLTVPQLTTPAPNTQLTTPAPNTQLTTPAPNTQTTESDNGGTNMTTQQVANISNIIINIKIMQGIAAISADSSLVVLNMALPNIFIIVLPSGPLHLRLSKVSQISCSLMCSAIEISSVVLFCVADPINVTLVALLCVAIVIHFMKLVMVCLPIGPSHELKEICDHAVKVFSEVHLIFTIAVIFVGVLEIDNCKKTDYWLLKTMITFTVWTFLFVIWDFVSSTQRNTLMGKSKTGSPQNGKRWRQRSKETDLSGAEGIVVAVSLIFIFGSLCFAVAIAVGVFGC